MKTTKAPILLFLTIFLVSLSFIIVIVRTKKPKPTLKETLPARPPAVAGSFYPGSQKELDATISALLSQAELIPATQSAKILIVPHAGLSFSGQVAAWGFKQIKENKFTRIILLGASHRHFLNYASIFEKGFWETPLGKVEVDQSLAQKIINGKETVADNTPHQDEHSLEIELIFLQKVLKNFKIAPILLSQTSNELIEILAKKISENLDGQTLLVVSTDLSHYPPYEVANKVDNETIKAILTGKKDAFEKTLEDLESKGYPGVETCACGAEAIKVALKVAEATGIEFKKIMYENSGDVGGDKNQVVGYAAVVGYAKSYSAD